MDSHYGLLKEITRKYRIVFSSLFLSLFCTVGCFCPSVSEKMPNYPLKESWKHQSDCTAVEISSPENWWEVFHDKNLNLVITEGLKNSPSIEQSLARFEQSSFIAKSIGADQYPQLSLNGYGDRRRIPKDLQASASVPTGNMITPTTPTAIPTPATTGVPPIVVPAIPVMKTVTTPTYVNNLIANLLVSYELDFWGKYYLRTKAAMRRAEEAEADLATARLLLANQIASTYFTIQAMNCELSLIKKEIEVHSERLLLLTKQCTTGLTNTFQLLDEEATLQQKKTDEQSFLQSKEVNLSLLAVLAGREPNNSSFTISSAEWSFPVVPTGLPSTLLAKRPDIKTRMKEVEACIAEIGAAKTELLPSISLSAAAGYQAGVANEWFKWKDRIWALAGSVAQPLFDTGQRFAEIDAAKSRFKEAAGALTQTVLSSVKEVEDALVAIRTQSERLSFVLKKEEALAQTNDLRSQLCTTGVQDYLIVLQTKENLIQIERERINEEYNLQLGTLSLMKSLGGSWGSTPVSS